MSDEELQELKDNFYCGNFQKALALCESLSPADDLAQNEVKALLARCCLAIPLFDRLKAMQNSQCPGQQAAACMAFILKSQKEEQRAVAKEKLSKLAAETHDVGAAMLHTIVLAMDGSWNEALQETKTYPTLEMQALCVFMCLSCHQYNMAERKLAEMAGNNDDSAAYRLAMAAVKLATGDPEEAYLTYCDLSTQFPPDQGGDSETGSVLLETGKALANMQRGMFTEALEDLLKVAPLAPNDPDVLVNLCCCTTNLGKKEEFNQYLAKLEQTNPTHPFVVKSKSLPDVFARFAASLTA
eukprot:CAMPEP_0206448596 /NCGR_PEP_ID=MMETSP0324_2-20121206/17563_1 /ASSEMBLY_ACC=CAM_ASM_000836 /TAXON_ID=2866 /ORGANISM="Crypthecodinium cohnii, Strain Seligo" /LENGTH=297 /DNA_ID=CAMNT_0053917763 /DNA_START=30 /DNA_END=923 /DNA_ORIENTATION=+